MATKAGLIGVSDGNGHPYSWSAIVNGFDLELISKCGYPVISQYLKDKKPLPLNKDFEISHIYCSDLNQAKFISRACNISNICLSIQEMISQVDCFIIAKSDYWNHQELLESLAPLNLPIMIDKPMHVSLYGLEQLYKLESYTGQFFTCSSSRFSNNFLKFINQLGKNDDIHCETLNSWELYSVHLIDPLVHFGIISSRDKFDIKTHLKSGSSQMKIENNERTIYITATHQSYGTINFQSNENTFLIDDYYESFSNLLDYFSRKVIASEPFKENKQETKEIVSIISRNI